MLNPNYAPAHAGLGSNLFRAGRFEDSLDSHRMAVELDPRDNQYRIFLANAYWTVAQSERDLGIIRDAIEANPDVPSNYLQMSHWLLQLGRAGEALHYAQQALERDPNSAWARTAVCDGYDNLLMTEEAARCRKDYLARNPDDVMAQLAHLNAQGRYEEALEQVDAMIANGRGPRFLKELRIALLFNLERWQGVVDDVEKLYPQLVASDPVVDKWNIWLSTYLVHSCAQLEDMGQARKIAEAGIDFLSRQRRMQGGVHVVGSEDAGYYASLGERELMLERLDAAIESGWVRFAMSTLESHLYEAYRDDDAFQALVEKLETRLAAEREEYLASL